MKIRLMACASVAALSLTTSTAAAVSAQDNTNPPTGFDPARLESSLDSVRDAGMPGIYAEVRDTGGVWRGASGVADVTTGTPIGPGMRQRVGSITKTFTAAAILQQAEKGRIRLDAPIAEYLPELMPGERGRKITVRMLLNHTSGIADYLLAAFPSLANFPSLPDMSPRSLDDNRFTRFRPAELIELGLDAPATGEPGALPGAYSVTNYLILGRLLERVSGTTAEKYLTRNVIERAGLRHTGFPDGPRIDGPHPRMYEALYGLIDPPRDYSVYDMSWVWTGAALVSTMEDLNHFYGDLLAGKIVNRSSLAQMQQAIPVYNYQLGQQISYGLGLQKVEVPGCGTFWGHGGTVWGAGTMSLTRADGKRQLSVAMNLTRWNTVDSSGKPQPHPIDDALSALYQEATCGHGDPRSVRG